MEAGLPEQALRSSSSSTDRKAGKRQDPRSRGDKVDCIRRFRQQHSLPVLNALKTWLDNIAPKVVLDTKLGDAVSYTKPTGLSDALHQRWQDADR